LSTILSIKAAYINYYKGYCVCLVHINRKTLAYKALEHIVAEFHEFCWESIWITII